MTSEHEVTINEDLETDENTEWIQASGWARWFRHKPFPLRVAAATVPPPGCPTPLHLGTWYGVECSSSQNAEKTLGLLVRAAFEVIDRCLGSLQRTPRDPSLLGPRLGSDFLPIPFRISSACNRSAIRANMGERIVLFLPQLESCSPSNESTSDVCAVEFTAEQEISMHKVWVRLEAVDRGNGRLYPCHDP